MNRDTTRKALLAHGWLGLIISVPLFIVFWTGSFTLFYPEISRWSVLPQYPIVDTPELADIDKVIQSVRQDYKLSPQQTISLRLPGEHTDYLSLSFNVPADNGESTKNIELLVDPNSGYIIGESGKFEIAEFLYQLHYNLKIPQGSYIVGLITLFFLLLIVTGLLIQLKNLIQHFFVFRHKSSLRTKMKDLHTVIGVISLPYMFIYALTGLMFNLGVLFQIPSAVLLYDGNTNAMIKDAGFVVYNENPVGIEAKMPDIDDLITKFESNHSANVTAINLYNYSDQAAAIRITGFSSEGFSIRIIKHFIVKSNSYDEKFNPVDDNTFALGLEYLNALHFANFAGFDIRFLFFILGLGVAGMIVAGNVLWFTKYSKSNSYPYTVTIVKALTLGGCVGVIPATAGLFLLERVIPESTQSRVQIVELGFVAILFLYMASGFITQYSKRYVGIALLLTGSLLTATFFVDWLMFKNELIMLFKEGFKQPAYISISLIMSALVFFVIGKKLLITNSRRTSNDNHSSSLINNKPTPHSRS